MSAVDGSVEFYLEEYALWVGQLTSTCENSPMKEATPEAFITASYENEPDYVVEERNAVRKFLEKFYREPRVKKFLSDLID